MNTYLETLFDKHKVSIKNRYEIEQMYMILPDHKKKNLIKNFEVFLAKFIYIEKSIEDEKEILIWDSVERVKNHILQKRKTELDKKIKNEINLLKGEL